MPSPCRCWICASRRCCRRVRSNRLATPRGRCHHHPLPHRGPASLLHRPPQRGAERWAAHRPYCCSRRPPGS
eukprot:6999124-Alexandrium_andersonii.AAC.1